MWCIELAAHTRVVNPLVESALISGGATLVGVGGTVAVAIAGFRFSRSTTRAAIDAAAASADKTVEAARLTNREAIEAAHRDVRHTLETTRGGQIADLYGRAIEQIGSDKLDVRVGGIFAMERVARDSGADQPTVIEVLSAFVCEHSRELQDGSDQQERERCRRADVEAALTVIMRRDTDRDIRPLRLVGAVLTGATLTRTELTRADFTCAILTHAGLIDAKLGDARLTAASLRGAELSGADLSGANLSDADLTGAKLGRANLIGADFQRANCSHATFQLAN